MEAFFRSRGARVAVDLCPLADPGFLQMLAEIADTASTEFNNVLVKRLAGTEIMLTPRVRRAHRRRADLWSHTVGRGFFEQHDLTTEEMDVGRAIFAMPGALCYLAASGERRAGRRRGPRRSTAGWPRCLPTAPSPASAAADCTAN